jgi:hypothetical protein
LSNVILGQILCGDKVFATRCESPSSRYVDN